MEGKTALAECKGKKFDLTEIEQLELAARFAEIKLARAKLVAFERAAVDSIVERVLRRNKVNEVAVKTAVVRRDDGTITSVEILEAVELGDAKKLES